MKKMKQFAVAASDTAMVAAWILFGGLVFAVVSTTALTADFWNKHVRQFEPID